MLSRETYVRVLVWANLFLMLFLSISEFSRIYGEIGNITYVIIVTSWIILIMGGKEYFFPRIKHKIELFIIWIYASPHYIMVLFHIIFAFLLGYATINISCKTFSIEYHNQIAALGSEKNFRDIKKFETALLEIYQMYPERSEYAYIYARQNLELRDETNRLIQKNFVKTVSDSFLDTKPHILWNILNDICICNKSPSENMFLSTMPEADTFAQLDYKNKTLNFSKHLMEKLDPNSPEFAEIGLLRLLVRKDILSQSVIEFGDDEHFPKDSAELHHLYKEISEFLDTNRGRLQKSHLYQEANDALGQYQLLVCGSTTRNGVTSSQQSEFIEHAITYFVRIFETRVSHSSTLGRRTWWRTPQKLFLYYMLRAARGDYAAAITQDASLNREAINEAKVMLELCPQFSERFRAVFTEQIELPFDKFHNFWHQGVAFVKVDYLTKLLNDSGQGWSF